jgi:two-component system cell cycle response regulator DivK
MYAEMLRHAGYRVLEAGDGLDALAKAMAESPGLIVMDLVMPVLDGLEAIRHLKADLRTEAIPVIALTGCAFERHEDAMHAGCEAYLVKPCAEQDLVGLVGVVLLKKGQAHG